LGAIIRYLTKNENVAFGVCFILLAGTIIAYFVDATKFEGLLPSIMAKLSLFEQFNVFVNGVFDMTAIVYYFSVIAFFLFLSVQSLEKRRYN
jgi:ABC-2 type transport system permease protein